MPTPEVETRFLRPAALKDNLDSSWNDTQHAWIPSKEHGYVFVSILGKAEEGQKILVEFPDRTVNAENLLPCNATRYDRCEDIAEMGELNEATVLYNLKQRYDSNLIYSYSGLFLVAINPYRNFPIYTEPIMSHYKGQRRVDRPPHIFAVADAAYRAIIENRRNQSILITGESGAGKTENTKRVIQYLAGVAGGTLTGVHTLEQQIIRANPVLEAFGNAQTVRNNNSSRFGKFVRIEFNNAGVICGANIEKYLLEKGRVTHRNPEERSFHIFYQFLAGASEKLKMQLGIDGEVEDFNYTRQSNFTVEGVDDRMEFLQLQESMRVLGFGEEEQLCYFRIIAAILLLGNLSFAEDAQGQAKLVDYKAAERVCACLGISIEEFIAGLLNPVFKAGRDEVVTQARDMTQVVYSIEALSRTLYDRMFTRLVERINLTIDKATSTQGNFIGVLDIAGFEIFEKNSFEQLCINHTNEKLQQFFNHHMFIIEQEEYKREAIQWDYIDFGLDLQPTIDLIEKANPIGILACLDEDCVVPRTTDKSFCDKICNLWKGKSEKFEGTRFGDGFVINHYAGKVEYGTEGWLVKNKDPLNENITRLLARSSISFVSDLFGEFSGTDEQVYQANKGTKKGLFRTVAQKHRESLALLMQTLYATQPHFVRCIVPNNEKRPGIINASLVLDQLKCNGVLEGIRVCRLGYPNRLPFADFCRLYEILAIGPLPSDSKAACNQLLGQFGLVDGREYKLGQTKVFFKAGQISRLDEVRDRKLSAVLRSLQALYRYTLAKRQRNKKARQSNAVQFLQRNVRLYLRLRQWAWWKLYSQVKPLLNVTRSENRIEELELELTRLVADRDHQLTQIRGDLTRERDMLFEVETRRRELERENQQLEMQLAESNEVKAALLERKMVADLEVARLKERITVELEGQREQLQQRLNAQEKEQIELCRIIDTQKNLIVELRTRADEAEFEKLKLEKSEAAGRQRLGEIESLLEEARRGRKDLEAKLRQVEDSRRHLQEQLEDEAADQAKRRQIEAEFEAQLSQAKQQHEDDLTEREEEWDQMRKRLQREIHQLNFDFEQEKRQAAGLRETLKRYESGADSLATQLEAEMRNQTAWKREKERLEQRLKEISRQHQEAVEREDALQATLLIQSDTLREGRTKAADLEEQLALAERQRKTLEARYETLSEQHREVLASKQVLEKSCASLELQALDLSNKLHDEQDSASIQCEQIKTVEQLLKVTQIELESERKNCEKLTQEKAVLEMQIKELQLKLLDYETNQSTGTTSRAPQRRPSSAYQSILAQIEADGSERVSLVKDVRRQERLIRELNSQVAERDRARISLEESLDKCELRVRKLQTIVEALENRNSELEVAKRRAERDMLDDRDKVERLARECERLKGRTALRTSADEATNNKQ